MRKSAFLVVVFLCCMTRILGQDDSEDELIQEFFLGETVYLQEQGSLQLTLGPAWFSGDPEQWTVPIVAEYGFTDHFQAAVSIPYIRLEFEDGSQRGLGDSELEFAYGFSDNLDTFAFTSGIGVLLPSGERDKGLGEGETTLELFAVVARRFGISQVHAGFDYEPEESEMGFDLTLLHPWSHWRGTLGLNAETGEEDLLFLTPGLTLSKARTPTFQMEGQGR